MSIKGISRHRSESGSALQASPSRLEGYPYDEDDFVPSWPALPTLLCWPPVNRCRWRVARYGLVRPSTSKAICGDSRVSPAEQPFQPLGASILPQLQTQSRQLILD